MNRPALLSFRIVLFLLMSVYTLGCTTSGPKNSSVSKGLVHISCSQQSGEAVLNFKGRMTLDSKLFGPKGWSTADFEQAAHFQIKYLLGYFSASKSANHYVIPVLSKNSAVITSIKNIQYGRALSVRPIVHPDVKIESPYILNAIQHKGTLAQDPAVEVEYDAQVDVSYCLPKADEVTIQVPVDPLLEYWTVADSLRVKRNWFGQELSVYPCADRELVDIPHPEFLWYFWRPGTSDKLADCKRLLKDGRDYFTVKARLTTIGLNGSLSSRDNQLIKDIAARDHIAGTVIFGIINPKLKTYPFQKLVKAIPSQGVTYQDYQSRWLELFPNVSINSKPGKTYNIYAEIDSSAVALARFNQRLSEVLDMASATVKPDPASGTVIVSSTFKGSKKHIDLRIFYGATDQLASIPPQHWSLFLDSLKTSDFISYLGHSGLGENLRLSNLLESQKINDVQLVEILKTAPRNQAIGIFSCSSLSYFGDDIGQLRKKANATSTSTLYLTGGIDPKERGHLYLLRLIQNYGAGIPNAEADAKALFNNDDIVLQKSVF